MARFLPASVVTAGVALNVEELARARLGSVFPDVGPWTAAALWHGIGPEPAVPKTPLGPELQGICDQRLAGLLLRFVRERAVAIPPVELEFARRTTFLWTQVSTRAISGTSGALDLLDAAEIRSVVSKGPGISRFYPSRECRPFSDIDVLVDVKDFRRSTRILEDHGWLEDLRNRQPWPYFRRYCREGMNLHNIGGGSLDLHHRIPPWVWSTSLHVPEMVQRSEIVNAGVRELRCLSALDNLLVACLHLVSDRNTPGRTLLIWRDLVQLARAVPVDDAVRAATSAGLAGWLRTVLVAMPEAVRPLDLLLALPDEPILHPRRLAALLSERSGRIGVVASQFLRLPIGNGLAFIAGTSVPSRSFLAIYYPSMRHSYLRWWTRRFRNVSS